jgi:hypothetical protein
MMSIEDVTRALYNAKAMKDSQDEEEEIKSPSNKQASTTHYL